MVSFLVSIRNGRHLRSLKKEWWFSLSDDIFLVRYTSLEKAEMKRTERVRGRWCCSFSPPSPSRLSSPFLHSAEVFHRHALSFPLFFDDACRMTQTMILQRCLSSLDVLFSCLFRIERHHLQTFDSIALVFWYAAMVYGRCHVYWISSLPFRSSHSNLSSHRSFQLRLYPADLSGQCRRSESDSIWQSNVRHSRGKLRLRHAIDVHTRSHLPVSQRPVSRSFPRSIQLHSDYWIVPNQNNSRFNGKFSRIRIDTRPSHTSQLHHHLRNNNIFSFQSNGFIFTTRPLSIE